MSEPIGSELLAEDSMDVDEGSTKTEKGVKARWR